MPPINDEKIICSIHIVMVSGGGALRGSLGQEVILEKDPCLVPSVM